MNLYATRLCPEYTLWAEQQASGTCSVALLGFLAQEVAVSSTNPFYGSPSFHE